VEGGLSRTEALALIEAALAPLRAELRRVDQAAASAEVTDALHERIESVEDRLFGERRGQHERPAVHAEPGVQALVLARIDLLERSVEAIEQAADRDRLRIQGELTELRGHFKALMTLLANALLMRLGVDLRPEVWKHLGRMG
jgi:hypothetical protein